MSGELEGRRALVTGAASGIGLAIAKRLAEAGARVALSDVDEAGAVAQAEAIGGGAIGLRCDVRSTEEVNASTSQAAEAMGGIDILVNNAGVEVGAAVTELGVEDLARMLDINVVGVLRCTQAAIPHLAATKGNIVNIASVAGLGGAPLLSGYCASKAGVLRMTETWAIELRDAGIRVNAVCPAFVDTPMVERLVPKVEAVTGMEFSDIVAIKQARYGTVEEVAEVVLFLASDDASWTTGSHMVLDGGLHGSLL